MQIIDTHAHLDHLPDVKQALVRAAQAGVTDIIAVGVDLNANKINRQIKMSTQNPRIHVAFGIHPANIKLEEIEETFRFIREHIREAIAVGETGLDYWYKWVKKDEAAKQAQRDCFQKHLELAREFDLPIIIHSRGAWQDCLDMTKAAGVRRANFHWYSGPVDILKEILSCGFFVSTSPSVGYSPQSREAMSNAPIKQTLIETDAPVFYRTGEEQGFQAEPKDVVKTLQAYAKLKNMNEQDALLILNNNARKFFGIEENK